MLVPKVHGAIAADDLLEGLQLPDVEDGLPVVVVREPGLYFLGSITVVVKGPQLHRLVFAPGEEVVLPSQRRQALSGAGVTEEALQSDLVKVEVRVLLVEANLVLPVRQPVALQGATAARELLLQGALLKGGARYPRGGGTASCRTLEAGGRRGVARGSPRAS